MRLLGLVLLLPFLVFSTVKPGTMLAADAQGRIMVQLCGAHAPVEMAVAADGTLTPVSELGHAPAPAKAPCGWGLHALALAWPPAAALPLPERPLMPMARARTAVLAILPALPASPWPRGPPRAA